MNIYKNNISLIYFLLYLSMLAGYYLNEDFAGGTIVDYLVHIRAANLMEQDIMGTFLKYDDLRGEGIGGAIPHSPIYILYFMFMQNFFGDTMSRLINMHLILLIPYFSYLSLKLKFSLNKNDLRNLLPIIFFISPYFRSGAFWIDDNVIGLTFLTISFYFYLRIENYKNKSLNLIFLHVLFLALAAYFRPIYSIFGIYFFLSFYSQLHFKSKFFYYIFFNIILCAPAFYFVFILGQNEWFQPWFFRTNNTTIFSLALSVIFFYSIPFIFCNLNKIRSIIINKKIIFLSILYLIFLLLNFSFKMPYSGGIFYKTSNLIFSNNYFFYFISFLSFYFFLLIFKNFTVKKYLFLDLTLLILLILMEMDGMIYHEAYDPLFYILSFILIKNKFYYETIKNISFKKLNYFYLFNLSFFIASIAKSQI